MPGHLYYKPKPVGSGEAQLRRLIDQIYTKRPFLGSRGVKRELRRLGVWCNRKRIQPLMRAMGLESIAPEPNTYRAEERPQGLSVSAARTQY